MNESVEARVRRTARELHLMYALYGDCAVTRKAQEEHLATLKQRSQEDLDEMARRRGLPVGSAA